SPFAINADGSLTQIPCPGTTCDTRGLSSFGSVATGPDQAPTAAFSATPGFTGNPTTLDGSGSAAFPGQSVAHFDWDFGDGTTAPDGGAAPTHVYGAPGTYTVSLTVTDDAGCSTSPDFNAGRMTCNGGPSAHVTHAVTIANVPPPEPPNTKISNAKI